LRTLGIDPGSRFLGFGVIEKNGTSLRVESYGTLRFDPKKSINERLPDIYEALVRLLEIHRPDHVAIEKVFFAKDVTAALKLGMARGCVILSVMQKGIPLFEYSPNEIKQATVGFGHADKDQVARMVSLLLGVRNFDRSDSSDALAIAICHLQSYTYRQRVGAYDRASVRKNPK
jgi:crossover junction endodeoxyribonuclease RuvC